MHSDAKKSLFSFLSELALTKRYTIQENIKKNLKNKFRGAAEELEEVFKKMQKLRAQLTFLFILDLKVAFLTQCKICQNMGFL